MTNHQKMKTTIQFNHRQIKLKNNQPNQFKITKLIGFITKHSFNRKKNNLEET